MNDISLVVKKINSYLNDPLYKNTDIAKYISNILKTNSIDLNYIDVLLSSPLHLQLLMMCATYINNNSIIQETKTQEIKTNEIKIEKTRIHNELTCDLCKEKIKNNSVMLLCQHLFYHKYCSTVV